MTGHLDFRDGRRLDAADLNREDAARAADLARHLHLAHPHGDPAGSRIVVPGGGPRLEVTTGGPAAGVRIGLPAEAVRVGAPGGHRVHHGLTADTVAARDALRLIPPPAPGPDSVPWSVRAVDVRDDEGRLRARELRVELSAPDGAPPDSSRVSVGRTGAGHPSFRVDAGGTVTVDGDLLVGGSVAQGAIPPDPEDPRFVALLTDVVARRIVGAASGSTTPAFALTPEVVPAQSSPARTVLDILLKPATETLAWWGCALAVRRSSSAWFVLLQRGRNTAPPAELHIPATVRWTPDLSPASQAALTVAVAAFDSRSQLLARSATLTVK